MKFRYDNLNRVTNMVDAAGTTAYTFTPGGQLQTEDGPFASDAVTNIYSHRLRVEMDVQQPTGFWWNTFGYDAAKRLAGEASPAGTFGYGYVAQASRLPQKLSLPNGGYITNAYDGNARLLFTKLNNSSDSTLDLQSYAYNAGNQRTAWSNSASIYALYRYDQIGQLTVASNNTASESRGYTYDSAWNLNYRTNNTAYTTFSVNGLNELTSIGGTTCAYDANGNVATEAARKSFTNTFTYDDENRLVSVTPTPATTQTTFVYDGLGRLREQLQWATNNSSGGGGASVVRSGASPASSGGSGGGWTLTGGTLYIYDGNRVIQERDINNNPTVAYTRGNDLSGTLEGAGGIGGLLARSDTFSSGNFTSHNFYHADGNGNITYLVSSSQALAASYRYDPFGNTVASSGTLATANTYRFSSKEWISSVSLYYYLYRFYDPNAQRWLNRDPLGEKGFEIIRNHSNKLLTFAESNQGGNSFAFLGNSTLGFVDADGLDWWPPTKWPFWPWAKDKAKDKAKDWLTDKMKEWLMCNLGPKAVEDAKRDCDYVHSHEGGNSGDAKWPGSCLTCAYYTCALKSTTPTAAQNCLEQKLVGCEAFKAP